MNKNLEETLVCNIDCLNDIICALKSYQASLVQIEYEEMIKQLEEVVYDLRYLKSYKPLFAKHSK